MVFRRNVDRARCLIEYEQERPPEHGARKAQALAFAAGNQRAALTEHGIQPGCQAGHEIVDAGSRESIPDLGLAGLRIGPQ
jgi:hypothetical protein